MQNFSVQIPFTKAALSALSKFANELAQAEDQPQRTFEVATPAPAAAPAHVEHVEEEETASNGEGLDADGYPWDARIHSSAKSKVKDGTWKLLRGVDPQLVEQVRAASKAPAAAVVTPPPAAAVVTPPPAAAVVTPPPAAAVVTPPPAAAAPAPEQTTFAGAMQLLSQATERGLFSQPDALAWLQGKGIASLAGMATNAAVRAEFVALLREILAQ